MLCITRKLQECVLIDGRILVKVIRVQGTCVKLGFEAPRDVRIQRVDSEKPCDKEREST